MVYNSFPRRKYNKVVVRKKQTSRYTLLNLN